MSRREVMVDTLNPRVNKTILFIAPVPPPVTGQSLACKALYDHLLELGYEVRLANLSKDSFKQGVSSISRFWEIGRLLVQVFRLRGGVDRVYFTPAESLSGNLKDLLIYLVLGAYRRVTYLHLHGGGGTRRLLSDRHPRLRSLNSWFLRQMAGIIVLGERHVSIYDGLVDPHRIQIVKNFAPDDAYITDEAFTGKLADLSTIRVLFLSNLIPGKGYQDLISAIQILDEKTKGRFFFDFAGGFESEADKEQFLKQIDSVDCVAYHGVVHGGEKRALLQNAHIFCLPSYLPEGQPISILEAYAAGCAVITTDCGGIFDIFSPGVNGVAVKIRNPNSIADALKQFGDDPELLRECARSNLLEARGSYRQDGHLSRLRRTLALN